MDSGLSLENYGEAKANNTLWSGAVEYANCISAEGYNSTN